MGTNRAVLGLFFTVFGVSRLWGFGLHGLAWIRGVVDHYYSGVRIYWCKKRDGKNNDINH